MRCEKAEKTHKRYKKIRKNCYKSIDKFCKSVYNYTTNKMFSFLKAGLPFVPNTLEQKWRGSSHLLQIIGRAY
jgi:hypothetical protein